MIDSESRKVISQFILSVAVLASTPAWVAAQFDPPLPDIDSPAPFNAFPALNLPPSPPPSSRHEPSQLINILPPLITTDNSHSSFNNIAQPHFVDSAPKLHSPSTTSQLNVEAHYTNRNSHGHSSRLISQVAPRFVVSHVPDAFPQFHIVPLFSQVHLPMTTSNDNNLHNFVLDSNSPHITQAIFINQPPNSYVPPESHATKSLSSIYNPPIPSVEPEISSVYALLPKPKVKLELKPNVISSYAPPPKPEVTTEVKSEILSAYAPPPKPEVITEVKPEILSAYAPPPKPELKTGVKPDVVSAYAPPPKPEVTTDVKHEIPSDYAPPTKPGIKTEVESAILSAYTPPPKPVANSDMKSEITSVYGIPSNSAVPPKIASSYSLPSTTETIRDITSFYVKPATPHILASYALVSRDNPNIFSAYVPPTSSPTSTHYKSPLIPLPVYVPSPSLPSYSYHRPPTTVLAPHLMYGVPSIRK